MIWRDPQVTRTYACALVSAVRSEGQLEASVSQAEELACLMARLPRLQAFLEGPHIAEHDKDELIRKILVPRVLPVLGRFLRLLVHRMRSEYVLDILEAFQEKAKEALGWTPGTVTSALPMTEEERRRLRSSLERKTGLRLDLKFKVEPEVLGGFSVRLGDLLLDTTLRSRIQALEERLRHAVDVEEG